MKKILFLLLFAQSLLGLAQTYTVAVGETQYLQVPSVSVGTVSKAVWACSNPEIQFVSKDEVGATIKVIKSFSGIATVELVYVQSYIGSYTGRIEAITYTKNYYIQCYGGTSSVSPTAISLPSNLTVFVENSIQIIPTFTPANASSTLSWSIQQGTGVAAINGRGIVTGVKSGTVTVYVNTTNGLSASCKVRVVDPQEAISVSVPKTQIVGIGSPVTLKCSVEPANSNTTLTWSSSDTSIATVRAGGIVTGKQTGETDITVKTTNGLTAVCHVIVKNLASKSAIDNAYNKAVNAMKEIYKLKE